MPILILLSALSLLDRQVLTLMVGPIKRDLGLSDLQIGLLQGIVFSLLYGMVSLPIGWLVDRFPRRPIIWLGVTFWGLAAACCGLARNFTQLFLARVGVGIGEASLSPAAYSMLADLFPPSRLALALSVFLVGSTVGNGVAVGLGGAIVALAQAGQIFRLPVLGALASWQYVFLVTGLPGLLLGLLIFAIREPARHARLKAAGGPVGETFRFMARRRRFFLAHFAGFGLLAVLGWAYTSWLPTYMVRSFGWTIGRLSLPLALIFGLGGTAGVLLTGFVVDRMFRAGRRDAHLRLYVAIAVGLTLIGSLAFQVRSPWFFLGLAVPIAMTTPLAATAAAALQIVSPNEMRGQITATFLLVINGLGLGIGPPLVGALTDLVFRDEARLGASIALLFVVLGPLSALLLAWGLRPMREAVDHAGTSAAVG